MRHFSPRLLAALLFSFLSVAPSASQGHVDDPLKGIDAQGQLYWLGRSPGVHATVLVFIDHECPIATQYIPELNRLAKQWQDRGVELFGVISNVRTSRKSARQFATDYQLQFPLLFDASSELAYRFQPKRVPEAFVLSNDGAVKYRGRIDDQWASLGKRRNHVTKRDLQDAVAATLAGESIETPETEVVGCVYEGLPRNDQVEVTYHRQIQPLLQANCQSCHRPGEVAPFSLTNYEEAASRAEMIAEVTNSKRMPPWMAESTLRPFHGERRLSAHEISLLAQWAAAGAPKGNVEDQPPAPSFPEGWQLGEPDLVLEMPESFTVPASGPDLLRYFVIPIPVTEDKDVIAFEFRPGNRKVCHHAILYVDGSGTARKLDEKDPGPGYAGFGSPGFQPTGMLGFWAPGYTPHFLPTGVCRKLNHQNADLALQLHYHPSGKEESDRSMVGLYFAKEPAPHRATEIILGTLNIDIPAGEPEHVVQSQVLLPAELEVVGITPHMHLIGKEMRLTATFPDKESVDLLWIKDWDFNWQDGFRLTEPIILPAGTKLDLRASYDNSADNPANPNSPPRPMLLGEESTDEMCLCVLHSIARAGNDNIAAVKRATREVLRKEMTPELLAKIPPAMKLDILRTLLGRRVQSSEGK